MSKKTIWALVLLGLTVVVIVFNSRGSVSVNILVTTVEGMKSLIYLAFVAVGIVIGVLLNK